MQNYPEWSAVIYESSLTLSGQNTGSATILIDGNANFAISGISGTINGATIEGLSNFNGADNMIIPLQNRNIISFAVSQKGFSFKAGGIDYNVFNVRNLSSTEYITNSLGSTYRTGVDYNGIYIIPTVCFAAGTRIRVTRDGLEAEVAVEDLRVGDNAVTASGALRPVAWTGHRHLVGHGQTLPASQQPIHVRAGAFGPGLPARDLRLSPGHPVLVGADENGQGGHLVPIMCLINGTSIVREPVSSVIYWHVELDTHDILLAEGLPAESYLDWGDRPFFTEASDHSLHNPDFIVPGLSSRCRPVVIDGPVVEAERARLSSVFAASLGEACAWDEAERFAWTAA